MDPAGVMEGGEGACQPERNFAIDDACSCAVVLGEMAEMANGEITEMRAQIRIGGNTERAQFECWVGTVGRGRAR